MLLPERIMYLSPDDGGASAPTGGLGDGGTEVPSGTNVPTGTEVPSPPSFEELDAMFGSSSTPELPGQSPQPPPSVVSPVGATPPLAPKVDGGSPAPQPPVVPAQSPELVAMQEQLRAVTAELTALKSAPPQPPAAPAQTPQWRSPYHGVMNVQPDVLAKLRSEDPAEAAQAYAQVFSDAAAFTHQHVMAEVGELLRTVVNQVLPNRQNQEAVARQFHNDFYKEWPKLDTELFKPVVGRVAAQMARERKVTLEGLVSSPQVRRLVAEEAVREIKKAWPGGSVTREVQTPPVNGAPPGTPRGGPTSPASSIADEVAELLAFG